MTDNIGLPDQNIARCGGRDPPTYRQDVGELT